MNSTTGVDAEYLEKALITSLAIPSEQTNRGEGDPAIRAFIDGFVAAELSAAGVGTLARDGMGNLHAKLPGNRGPTLLLVTFAMTHPAAGMRGAFEPQRQDGRPFGIDGSVIRGRGACEQKGPLAAALAAIRAAISRPARPAGDIHWLTLVSGETGTHRAIAHALEAFDIRADGAVVVVCSSNRAVRSHKGRVDVHVTIRGNPVHSSTPELGLSAIDGTRLVLERLASIKESDRHPMLGRRTTVVTRIETFPRTNHTIPGRAELTLDCRLLPGDMPNAAVSKVREALRSLEPFKIEVEAGASMYPSELDVAAPFARRIDAAVRLAAGHGVEWLDISAATDSGYLNAHGIPATCLGPGEIRHAHTDDDVVSLSQAARAAEIYLALMTDRARSAEDFDQSA